MRYIKDDGGRADSGLKGKSGDCSVRAYAIATGRPYLQTQQELKELTNAMTGGFEPSISGGVYLPVFNRFLLERGWVANPCKGMYLKDAPTDRTIIVSISRHFVAVMNGTVRDTWDCRNSRRTKCKSPKMDGYWEIGSASI